MLDLTHPWGDSASNRDFTSNGDFTKCLEWCCSAWQHLLAGAARCCSAWNTPGIQWNPLDFHHGNGGSGRGEFQESASFEHFHMKKLEMGRDLASRVPPGPSFPPPGGPQVPGPGVLLCAGNCDFTSRSGNPRAGSWLDPGWIQPWGS